VRAAIRIIIIIIIIIVISLNRSTFSAKKAAR